jgi:hypothetical protein
VNEEKALAATREFWAARIAGDFDRAAAMLDEDIQWVHGSGRTQTKAEVLFDWRRGRTRDLQRETAHEAVRIKGHVALVSGVVKQIATIEGEHRELIHFYTLTWSDHSGEMKLLNYQPTVIDDGRVPRYQTKAVKMISLSL